MSVSSYLVSFYHPAGQYGITYGSHVVDLPHEPSSAQAVLDLQASIGMYYGMAGTTIISWDFLHDGNTHPSGSSPYSYFYSYNYTTYNGFGFNNGTATFMRPIDTLDDVHMLERKLCLSEQVQNVHLMSCKALGEPTTQMLHDYHQQFGR